MVSRRLESHLEVDARMIINIDELSFIIGKWEGSGVAEYPTIASVNYDEGLVFTRNESDPVLHYEQRTWIRSNDEKNGQPVFWESGFIIDKHGGLFELVSAQKSGRVEILRGRARNADDVIEIDFTSDFVSNDARIIKSGRSFRFSKDAIEYELRMSTTSNPSYDRHLKARLARVVK